MTKAPQQDATITFRVSAAFKEEFRAFCDRNSINSAAFIRAAIAEKRSRHKAK